MLKTKLLPFFIAMSLLTSLPITKYLPERLGDKEQGLSVVYYSFVGLLLACITYGIYLLLPTAIAPLVGATVVVVVLIVLTGAIHLDGLADAVDAAYAAHSASNKEKILSVFKDPRAGPMAVVAVIVVVLSKVVLLSQLLDNLLLVLVAMLALPRLLASCYMATTPHARADGLAASLVKSIPAGAMLFMLIAISVFFTIALPITWGLVLFVVLSLLLLLWRSFWLKRINGFVGDCVGALIEMGEVLVLLLLYLLSIS